MISINSTAPFSIEKRLSDLVTVLGFADSAERGADADGQAGVSQQHGGWRLFWQVFDEAQWRGRSHLLISGITERAQMYRSLGFKDLGGAVPAGEVSYIPMAREIADRRVAAKAARFRSWWQRWGTRGVNLMPGPVAISRGARRAFEQPPLSHRSTVMIAAYNEVRDGLRSLTNGMNVALMIGSGTLANDAVGATLRARFGDARGVVLVNGEFGERLVRQARLAGLVFDVLQWSWGTRWNFDEMAQSQSEVPHHLVAHRAVTATAICHNHRNLFQTQHVSLCHTPAPEFASGESNIHPIDVRQTRRTERQRDARRGDAMTDTTQVRVEKFSEADLAGLREDLLRAHLDSWQVGDVISSYLSTRGYGVSNQEARTLVARIERTGYSLQTMQEELEKLALVM
jgi:hypothetical protein